MQRVKFATQIILDFKLSFWVIPRLLNFMYRRFVTLDQFHLYRWYEDGTDKVFRNVET